MSWTSTSYAILRPLAEKAASKHPDLPLRLQRAHVARRSASWIAGTWLAAILAGLFGFATVGALALLTHRPLLWLAAPLAGALFGAVPPLAAAIILKNRATELAREIDEALPHALNYMLSLANAGMPPREMFGILARAKVFGAIAHEAERIRRDLDLFGSDLLEALRTAQDRTPSPRFREFLQGAISAFQSGIELESYLRTKGAQYQHEAVEKQLKAFDTMGVLAEAFLVAVVAAPLFLIILLTVMALNTGREVLLYGYGLALLVIPLCQVVLGAMIASLNPKVWT